MDGVCFFTNLYNQRELLVFVPTDVQGCVIFCSCIWRTKMKTKGHAQRNIESKDTHTPLSEKIKDGDYAVVDLGW